MEKVKAVATEHQEQCALVAWANTRFFKFNDKIEYLGNYLVASQNGASLPYKKTAHGRYSPQANKLIKEGLKKGFPDLQLVIPNGSYHGLFIEMKRTKKSLSRVSTEQKAWQERLNKIGYKAVICYGFEEAKKAICDYLGLNYE